MKVESSSPSAPHAVPDTVAAKDHHRPHTHLRVVPPGSPPQRWRRPLVVLLSIASVAAFGASLLFPWWKLQLYAPQYPHGLTLVISLTKLDGDVHEISTLNHYIGMASLADAAKLEKELAVYAVAALGILTLASTFFVGKRFTKWLFVPGLLFPTLFLVDSFYWMYSFGHNLDPKAPLTIPPFTPQLFGNGTIGQFMTFAVPQSGFFLAVGGVVVLILATVLRGKVCNSCSRAGTCSAVCLSGFVAEPKAREP